MQHFTGVKVEYTLTGRDGVAYRSISDQRCLICGATILRGALFTRHTMPMSGTVCVICELCQPFVVTAPLPEIEVLAIIPQAQ